MRTQQGQKELDAYERPEMEVIFIAMEGYIADSMTETIDDDEKEHGWGGNS